MEEQKVSFETAKLAKEKGFNINCKSKYTILKTKTIFKTNSIHKANTSKSNVILVPTQSLLQKWLREKHGIDIQILGLSNHYYVGINKKGFHKCSKYFYPNKKSYEEVLEIGLQVALKLI